MKNLVPITHPKDVITLEYFENHSGGVTRVPLTYSINSERLTNFEYTAFAYPELGLCFVQGSATLNVSHAAGNTSYTIATLDDGFSQYIPGAYVPGSLRSTKNFDFAVTTNGHLAIWFNEAGAKNDTFSFAGRWIIGGDTT